MDLGIDEKAAIVTGGSKGIGKAIATRLAEEGARVCICARDEDQLAAAAADINGDVLTVQADVTVREDVEQLVEETVETFGTIDILVNNVGTTGSFESLEHVPEEEWQTVFETNLFGTMRMIETALPYLQANDWGRIVNVASDAGLMPHDKMPQYNASKAAMINLTTSLSKAYADDGLLVNAVAPPTTRTPLVESMFEEMADERNITVEEAEQAFLAEEKPALQFDRVAEPEEVAPVVALLASDMASYITGATYRIDGGGIPTINV